MSNGKNDREDFELALEANKAPMYVPESVNKPELVGQMRAVAKIFTRFTEAMAIQNDNRFWEMVEEARGEMEKHPLAFLLIMKLITDTMGDMAQRAGGGSLIAGAVKLPKGTDGRLLVEDMNRLAETYKKWDDASKRSDMEGMKAAMDEGVAIGNANPQALEVFAQIMTKEMGSVFTDSGFAIKKPTNPLDIN